MDNENTQNNTQEQEQEQVAKTYTEEEVLKLIQSESDKRVNQALETQRKKYDKQLSLSKLDGAEREKAERENKIAELEERLAEFQIEKNRSELKSVLSARGLSVEFADLVMISDDLETAQANIDKLDKLFKNAVKAEVERRLSGNTPQGNSNGSGTAVMNRENFAKLGIAEQQKLYDSNPDYYGKFL